MSSSGPILTIGIPTWNRKQELQECLDLVIHQALAEEGVEVMVCDNASDDGTQALVEDLVRLHPLLRYERNQTNIGADRNFIEVLRRASGTYVWILSDDDFVTDGTVRELLHIIKTDRPSYISVNYVYCDSEREITKFQPDQRYMLKQDVPHADINRTFLVRNHWLSFLSCGIYRRDLVDFDDILGSIAKVPNWIQVYMTAQVLAKGKDGYHSSFNGVLARVGNDRANATPFVAYMPEAFMYIFERFGVNKAVVDSVIQGIRETFLSFPGFLAYRARGLSPSPLIVPPHFKLGLILPRPLLVGIRKIYRLLRSRTKVQQSG
jgi:glycosyltransferase involved in cell wall biosynthesis